MLLKRFFSSFLLSSALLIPTSLQAAPPSNFAQAKVIAKQQIYYDRNTSAQGSLYCGCQWKWTGKSGGRIDFNSCGYQTRAQPNRAERIEYEHIVPASWFGQQRKCWQQGGRSNCTANDPIFSFIEADLHNLSPVVGEVNADRSNYRFGMVSGVANQYGQCNSKTDFKGRVFEPRDEAKGMVARTHFYMYDRYNLRMSQQQERLFIQWDRNYPISNWEIERNKRIYNVTGISNPFVTGHKQWQVGHKNSGEGLKQLASAAQATSQPRGQQRQQAHPQQQRSTQNEIAVKGNRNSKVYHLPHCPSYNAMADRNVVAFDTEQQAVSAGFRKAGNC